MPGLLHERDEDNRLVILTTSDADFAVMCAFGQALSDMASGRMRILWRVVDGLQVYKGLPPDLADAAQDMDVAWHDPGQSLSQAEAIFYGLGFSRGARVLLMTPDMIANIQDIPAFIEKMEEGFDVVAGWRVSRIGISRVRLALTRLFNVMAKRFFRLPIHDFNTCMGLLSPAAVESLVCPPEGCPSAALNTACTFRGSLSEVPITVHEIPGRKSAYTIRMRMALGVMRLKEMMRFYAWYKLQEKASTRT